MIIAGCRLPLGGADPVLVGTVVSLMPIIRSRISHKDSGKNPRASFRKARAVD